jgi:hypothetical protein
MDTIHQDDIKDRETIYKYSDSVKDDIDKSIMDILQRYPDLTKTQLKNRVVDKIISQAIKENIFARIEVLITNGTLQTHPKESKIEVLRLNAIPIEKL